MVAGNPQVPEWDLQDRVGAGRETGALHDVMGNKLLHMMPVLVKEVLGMLTVREQKKWVVKPVMEQSK